MARSIVPDGEWAKEATDADLCDALLLWVGAATVAMSKSNVAGDGIFLAAEIVHRMRQRPSPGSA